MKGRLLKVALSVSVALGVTGQANASDKVMIGELTWPGAKAVGFMIKAVIEDKIGGEAEMVTSTNPIIFSAMDGGRGDIDVHPDVWLPNQQALVDKYVKQNGTVKLSSGAYKGQTGFCEPRYMKDKHGIKSVYDLASPTAQSLFDSDGDGKGEIWVGAPGWSSTNINKVKARDYGIELFNTVSTEDEAIFYNRLESLYKAEKGVAFYCYTPHYIQVLYDMVMLEEPKHDPAQYRMLQPNEDKNWFEKSTITSADPEKNVRVAYSASLEKRAPQVATFLSNIDLKAQYISEWTYQSIIQGKDPEAIAHEWVKTHSDVVDKWLGIGE